MVSSFLIAVNVHLLLDAGWLHLFSILFTDEWPVATTPSLSTLPSFLLQRDSRNLQDRIHLYVLLSILLYYYFISSFVVPVCTPLQNVCTYYQSCRISLALSHIQTATLGVAWPVFLFLQASPHTQHSSLHYSGTIIGWLSRRMCHSMTFALQLAYIPHLESKSSCALEKVFRTSHVVSC